MILSLDSSIFKNIEFLLWLKANEEKVTLYISVLVYIETLLWYLLRGLTEKRFKSDLKKLHINVVPVSEELGDTVATIAKKYNKQLPFKHHARDYVIGVTAIKVHSNFFLTYNKKHYQWLNENGTAVMTPEEFLETLS